MPEYNRYKRPSRVRVSFLPLAREAEVGYGESVLDAAREAGLSMDAPCGGRGYCGDCRVKFVDGAPEPGTWDRLHLAASELEEGARLGCTACVTQDAILSLPRRNPLIELDGRRPGYRLSPPARRAHVKASASNLTNETLELLPSIALGDAPRELTLHLLGDELRAVELGWRRSDHLGVAVCVQGAWLRGWLMDLATGEQLTTATSRMIGEQQAGDTNADAVTAATRRLVRSLCMQARRRLEDVADIILTGVSEVVQSETEDGAIRVAGVGEDQLADAACGAAVAAQANRDYPTLLIALEPYPWAMCVDGEQAWLAAAPGWRLNVETFAAAGTAGAVEEVSFGTGVELGYTSGAPNALTLAGALDCTVALRRLGLLDRRGRLVPRSGAPAGTPPELVERLPVTPGDRRAGFRLWGSEEHPGVVLHHGHVRSLQRLRALVSAACIQALEQAGLTEEDVDRVLLIGEEAGSLRAVSAAALGMLPEVPPSLVQTYPAAVGAGAQLALLSAEAGRDIATLARRCVRLPDVGATDGWAQGLYLDLRERATNASAPALDGRTEALLDFASRGSGGIGRRASLRN